MRSLVHINKVLQTLPMIDSLIQRIDELSDEPGHEDVRIIGIEYSLTTGKWEVHLSGDDCIDILTDLPGNLTSCRQGADYIRISKDVEGVEVFYLKAVSTPPAQEGDAAQ